MRFAPPSSKSIYEMRVRVRTAIAVFGIVSVLAIFACRARIAVWLYRFPTQGSPVVIAYHPRHHLINPVSAELLTEIETWYSPADFALDKAVTPLVGWQGVGKQSLRGELSNAFTFRRPLSESDLLASHGWKGLRDLLGIGDICNPSTSTCDCGISQWHVAWVEDGDLILWEITGAGNPFDNNLYYLGVRKGALENTENEH